MGRPFELVPIGSEIAGSPFAFWSGVNATHCRSRSITVS